MPQFRVTVELTYYLDKVFEADDESHARELAHEEDWDSSNGWSELVNAYKEDVNYVQEIS